MKKLLSLLSVLTISGTAMPIVISTSPYKKEKNNSEILKINRQETKSTNEFLDFKNKNDDIKYFEKIKEIEGSVNNLLFDKKQNIYFSVNDKDLYILKKYETAAKKIEEIKNGIRVIKTDINNNIYIGTDDGVYILKENETRVKKLKDYLEAYIVLFLIIKITLIFIKMNYMY
ncbi:hypothetical protein [Spiroplasma endosymbiont of Polydrusus cervinus]|uniref:hypothetical protein n=1 Tax=Spiroplasma endosymbiont of Polydrusus cervinus TaxID=3066287 RepID=UPI0030D054B4